MDVNAIGPPPPQGAAATPVAHAPASVSRVSGDDPEAHPARDERVRRGEEPAPKAPDRLAARTAAKTRGGTRLRVDEASDRIVAQIVNAEDQVIKQIPPEEDLRVAARIRNIVGLLFNRQA